MENSIEISMDLNLTGIAIILRQVVKRFSSRMNFFASNPVTSLQSTELALSLVFCFFADSLEVFGLTSVYSQPSLAFYMNFTVVSSLDFPSSFSQPSTQLQLTTTRLITPSIPVALQMIHRHNPHKFHKPKQLNCISFKAS
jgi:hypothetical protein